MERYCDLVQIRCTNSESGNAVLSDHQFDKDDCETVGILADVCALIVFKMFVYCSIQTTPIVMYSHCVSMRCYKMQQSA